MNAYIWNLEKNGTDEHICMAEIEMQTERIDLWTQQGKESVGLFERAICIYITMCKIDS